MPGDSHPAGSPPGRYRITVSGEMTDYLAPLFDAMDVRHSGARTEIVGFVADQSELLGIIDTVSNLGLELISVEPHE